MKTKKGRFGLLTLGIVVRRLRRMFKVFKIKSNFEVFMFEDVMVSYF